MIIDFIKDRLGIGSGWYLTCVKNQGTENASRESIAFDSMLSIDVKAENQVAQEAVEQGSFASYNKLASPTTVTVKLAKGGYEEEQQDLLTKLDKLCASTTYVNLITPSACYLLYNLESYAYMRDDTSGAQLLTVELTLVEVRVVSSQTTTASKTSTGKTKSVKASAAKDKSSTSKVDTGKTQAKKPYTSVLASLTS